MANASLTPELAYGLGRAAGHFFKKGRPGRTKIIIGKDTRISGDMLEAALAAGLTSTGADVALLGVIPTPGVAYLCRELRADAGVMISASHNPVEDNGIKFFDSAGFKLTDAAEDEIETLLRERFDRIERPTGVAVGRISAEAEAGELYERFLLASVTEKFTGLKIVVDCGFGAAYELAPRILRKLGAEVIALNAANDGSRINVKCGSTNIEMLRQAVIANRADLGIAHDGDADRVIAADEAGQTVNGDRIMAVCALDLLRKGKLKNRKIAVTVYSNLGLRETLKRHQAGVVETANGDRYVLEALREKQLALGGEQSGHIIFLEKNTTGDGLLTALQLIAVVAESKKKLSELAGEMEEYPQILENVRVTTKNGWEDNQAIRAVIQKVTETLRDSGRLLVRASGTEPLIRVMAEGPDEAELKSLVAEIAVVIRRELG